MLDLDTGKLHVNYEHFLNLSLFSVALEDGYTNASKLLRRNGAGWKVSVENC